MKMILAVDPGSVKGGLAVLDDTGKVLERKLVDAETICREILFFSAKYPVYKVVVGRGVGSYPIKKFFTDRSNIFELEFVDEKFSTLEAKRLFFKDHPPVFLQKLLPISILIPARPIDDYSAVVLGRRYLKKCPMSNVQ